MKNNKKILQKLRDFFEEQEICVHLNNEVLDIHHGLSVVTIDNVNELSLSFEINLSGIICANITKLLSEYAIKNKYNLVIYKSFAHIFDEEDNLVDILYNEEAQYYSETGKLPIKKEKIKKQIDPQKKVDQILDKININGEKSLKKSEKQFLLNYSQGKYSVNKK